MIWLIFLLIWVGISLFTLGTYTIFAYLARTEKDSKFEDEWRDDAYQSLNQEEKDYLALVIGRREPTSIQYSSPDLNRFEYDFEMPIWQEDQYGKLRQLMEHKNITFDSIGPHLCLLCASPVEPPDNLSSYKDIGGCYDINGNFVDPPYCFKCYERLEQEGFFEE